jgi:hypothetical protein
LIVSLRAVAEGIEVPDFQWTAYLDRRTGEIIPVSGDDVRLLESLDEGATDVPEWPVEHLSEVREVMESEDFLALPGKDQSDEYRLMERFALEVRDADVSRELLRAIGGRRPFRRFKDVAGDRGQLDARYACRQRALEELAAEWLQAHGIAFTRP